MISHGNTGAISHTRALPIPTKPAGYQQRTPVRSGHVPIKCGTPRGYERHRELGMIPCKDCLKAVEAKPLKATKPRTNPCGTPYGYDRHRLDDTPVCDRCRDARRAYDAEWRRRKAEGREPTEGRARGPRFDLTKAQALREGGATIKQIAQQLGISEASVSRWTSHPRGVPRERLAELHAQGLPDVRIAHIVGLDKATVSKRLRRMGLERNLPLINHGTLGGYRTEKRRGLDVCDDCFAARRAYDEQRKREAS